MFNDHKGYYAILGVQAGATTGLIKAAYRVRAMELHPDRNASASATRETQLLNEAYQVLSDEARRREYDASCLQRNPETTHSTAGAPPSSPGRNPGRASQEEQTNEPVSCSSCQAVTLQPRYRELITVFSYLLGSNRTTRRGIFCVACERKYSALATGITSLLGWWGIYGFFWSFEALYKNLIGSWRFGPQDAMLSCAQAFYFAGKGNLDFAHAVAVDALRLAGQSSDLTRAERRRKSFGYEPQDRMPEVRAVMSDLIERTERAGFTKELVREPRLRQASFLVQAGLVGALLIAVALVDFNMHAENERIEAERARAEQARLEREGLARQQAQAIAGREAAKLRKLQQPSPPSGLISTSLPGSRFRSALGLPALRIHAPAGTNYFLRLSDWATGAPALAVFVQGGDTVNVDIPLGTYRVRMAAGTTWYGEKVRFGSKTAYSQIDQPLAFSVEGDRLIGHALELSQVRNGNLRLSQISPDQF